MRVGFSRGCECASHARAAGADLARVVQIQCMAEPSGPRMQKQSACTTNKDKHKSRAGEIAAVLWRAQTQTRPPGGNSLSTKSSAKLINSRDRTAPAPPSMRCATPQNGPKAQPWTASRLPTAVKSSLAPWQVRSSLTRTRLLACHSTSASLIRCICTGALAPLAATAKSLGLNTSPSPRSKLTNLFHLPKRPKATCRLQRLYKRSTPVWTQHLGQFGQIHLDSEQH